MSALAFGQKTLNFSDCLALAMKQNLEIQSANVNEEVLKYQYKASYGRLAPELRAEGIQRARFNQIYDFNTNSYIDNTVRETRGTVRANFNLFSGFNVWNTIKIQKQEYAIAKLNSQQQIREITISLAESYLTTLYLTELVKINAQQIQLSEKQLALAQLKYESGVIAESEVFKLKTQKANEELELVNNTNKLIDNWVRLKQLMNLPIQEELLLQTPAVELDSAVLSENNAAEITAKIIDFHPLTSMSLLRQTRAKSALAVARSFRYPELNAEFAYRTSSFSNLALVGQDLQFDRNRNGFLRLNLIVPIFNQLNTFSRIKQAKGGLKQAGIQIDRVRNQITQEATKAINDTKTARKRVETASIALEFSKKSYEADALKFELGKINTNELNITKNQYNNAQADLIQSNYELMYNNALINFYLGEEFKL
ncbi:MAG: TolC family protein [Flavobacterium psychrophilum]